MESSPMAQREVSWVESDGDEPCVPGAVFCRVRDALGSDFESGHASRFPDDEWQLKCEFIRERCQNRAPRFPLGLGSGHWVSNKCVRRGFMGLTEEVGLKRIFMGQMTIRLELCWPVNHECCWCRSGPRCYWPMLPLSSSIGS